jgi:hypothetical protein
MLNTYQLQVSGVKRARNWTQETESLGMDTGGILIEKLKN